MICPARRPLASLLRLLILAAAPACLVLALAAGTAVAASGPAPSLAIRLFSSPTRLAPGDETGEALYEVQVVNVGAAPTDGSPLTLTDELPEGVTVAPPSSVGAEELRLADDKFNRAPGASCEAVPQPHCTATSTLQPGESVTMWVPLHVSASAGGIAVNRASVSGGGAAPAAVTESTPFATGPLPFGFSALDTAITGGAGAPYAQAGGHPYLFRTYLSFNTLSKSSQENPPAGNPRDVLARLPRGMVVDPEATPVRCTEAEFESGSEGECPNASAIGLVRPIIGAFGYNEIGLAEPIYNMVPPHGSAASLAFNVAGLGLYVHLLGGVNSAGEYQLTASAKNVPQYGRFSGVTVELWGDPSDPSHDFRRGHCGFATGLGLQCPVASVSTPLLTMPSSCTSGPLRMSITADSWQEPEKFIEGSSVVENAVGEPLALEGCGGLEFSPSITSRPTTDHADSPTGLEFDLHQPQREDKEQLATANLKDARVTLPPGLTVNPSAANGLDACSAEQIGLTTAVGDAQPHFTEAPQGCPNGAKLGTLEVSTPLLEHKLAGAIYLASPYQNPFGSLLSIYLAIEDEETGIVAKLAGKVEPDPQTGQLTATFTENPELPIEDIDLHFFEGNGAALKTSLSCGTYTTNSDLTPWSAPEGADAHPSDSFTTDVAASGSGACPASESAAPDNPSFEAGTVAPIAGAFSPFVLRLARTDGSQQISGIDTTLPAGLTGKLAGIPYCPEGAIAQARSREAPNKGTTEKESPSCPPASEVGSVTVGAGAGAEPYYVAGHAYLAGPYKGAPLSLVIITPAVAGPFDLGTVVTRVALFVDPTTAQIHAVSDPLPTILQGIPLDIRSIALKLDRPSFTLNPTSCNPSAVTGSASSPAGAVAPLTNRFQVGGCDHLKFKPKLAVSLKGSTTRTGHPALKAVVTYPKQGAYSNVARAQVGLPHAEFLDQGNLDKTCTKPVLLEGRCPAGTVYGKAEAWSPLLEAPLRGNVYLVGGFGYELPALVAELDGQIRVLLNPDHGNSRQGHIDFSDSSCKKSWSHSFCSRVLDSLHFKLEKVGRRAAAETASARTSASSDLVDAGKKKGKKGKKGSGVGLSGQTKRGGHPALTATVTMKSGEANIARVAVGLPHSEFLDQSHIKTICTRVQFNEGVEQGGTPGANCPKNSIYGHARAVTPLLEKPLEGPVYLRSSSNKLPDLVVALNGQVNIVLDGRIDSHNQGIRTTFENVPDAPVSKFTLEMQGGKKGLLINSTNICVGSHKATYKALGQNGKSLEALVPLHPECKGQKHKKKKKKSKSHKASKSKGGSKSRSLVSWFQGW